MNTFIEIEWKNGKITRFPDTGYEGDNFGENVAPEIDIRFDDVSGGLYLEVRHHEPARPSQDELADPHAEPDPRGFPCRIYNDYYIELVRAEDMDDVVWVSYDGQPRFVRIMGELVNLAKIQALQKLYLGNGKADAAVLSQIAELASIVKSQMRGRLADAGQTWGVADLEEACAAELGVSRSILFAAGAFQAEQESQTEAGPAAVQEPAAAPLDGGAIVDAEIEDFENDPSLADYSG